MWAHYCKAEQCFLDVEEGQPCNWCGCTEYENEQTLENNDEFAIKQVLWSESIA